MSAGKKSQMLEGDPRVEPTFIPTTGNLYLCTQVKCCLRTDISFKTLGWLMASITASLCYGGKCNRENG